MLDFRNYMSSIWHSFREMGTMSSILLSLESFIFKSFVSKLIGTAAFYSVQVLYPWPTPYFHASVSIS